jgi:hypothetical protein
MGAMRDAGTLVVVLGVGLIASGCPGSLQFPRPPAGTPTYEERGDMTPGRIVDLDVRLAFMIVEFPWANRPSPSTAASSSTSGRAKSCCSTGT